MSVILLDVDEVLFPFAHAYDAWLSQRRGVGLRPELMATYRIPQAAGPDHDHLVAAFLNDPATVKDVLPVQGAAAALALLARTYTLVGCTSRHGHDEGAATRAWVARHCPDVAEVEFTRDRRGTVGVAKSVFARTWHAVALVDDSPEHLAGLPRECTGVLLARPGALGSSPEALSWPAAARVLCALT